MRKKEVHKENNREGKRTLIKIERENEKECEKGKRMRKERERV